MSRSCIKVKVMVMCQSVQEVYDFLLQSVERLVACCSRDDAEELAWASYLKLYEFT